MPPGIRVSLGISRALFATPELPPHSHSEVTRNLLHPGHGSVGPAPCLDWQDVSGKSVHCSVMLCAAGHCQLLPPSPPPPRGATSETNVQGCP